MKNTIREATYWVLGVFLVASLVAWMVGLSSRIDETNRKIEAVDTFYKNAIYELNKGDAKSSERTSMQVLEIYNRLINLEGRVRYLQPYAIGQPIPVVYEITVSQVESTFSDGRTQSAKILGQFKDVDEAIQFLKPFSKYNK